MAETKKKNTGHKKKKTQHNDEDKDLRDGTKDSRALLFFVIGIFGILILIIMGPKLYSNIVSSGSESIVISDQYYFNNFHFQKIGPLWYTQISKGNTTYDLPMHFGPKELTGFKLDNVTVKMIKAFFNEFVPMFREKDTGFGLSYVTFDPGDNMSNVILSTTELTIKLRQTYGIRLVSSCIDNSTGTGCEGRAMISCNNTEFPVIFLNEAGNGFDKGTGDGIYVKDNCLVIEGKGEDLLKMTDRTLYTLFWIMN
jgi:hypothetical protein